MPPIIGDHAVEPELRRATPHDAAAIAEVQVRAWQTAYVGLMPQPYLDSLDVGQRAEMWRRATQPRNDGRVLVAQAAAGRIAGFAAFGRERGDEGVDETRDATNDATSDRGELYALNVDPGDWGCGFGSALSLAVQAALAADGHSEAVLWVHPENLRAIRFYRRHGWAADGAYKVADALGVTVPEVRYHRASAPPEG